jgi:hypothetical protein
MFVTTVLKAEIGLVGLTFSQRRQMSTTFWHVTSCGPIEFRPALGGTNLVLKGSRFSFATASSDLSDFNEMVKATNSEMLH